MKNINPTFGHTKKQNRFNKGFTLIELMITVVIVSILASIAYGSYETYVLRSHRQAAVGAMFENTQFMERFFTSNASYLDSSGNPPTLPITAVPRGGGPTRYTFALATGTTATTYTINATRTGPQVNPKEKCENLSISQQQTRQASGTSSGGVTVDDCWQR